MIVKQYSWTNWNHRWGIQHFTSIFRAHSKLWYRCFTLMHTHRWAMYLRTSSRYSETALECSGELFMFCSGFCCTHCSIVREVLYAPNGQPFLIAGSGTLGWDQVCEMMVPGSWEHVWSWLCAGRSKSRRVRRELSRPQLRILRGQFQWLVRINLINRYTASQRSLSWPPNLHFICLPTPPKRISYKF